MSDPTIRLTGIYIYPVKSLRGVGLEEAALENGRLVGDREWMLVDLRGYFMHMRDYPQMARVEATITDRGLAVRTHAMQPLEIERPRFRDVTPADVEYVRLWRRSAPVVHVSHEADAWFTAALRVPCRLVAFVPEAPALTVPSYEVHSTLQDATPFHLTSEDSLADLNARMERPIPMNRFRPNIVVSGAEPYAEDRWRTIAVGDTTLRWIKVCTRCVATTTDQVTGERRGTDPLRTLATYRRHGAEVAFGHYLVADRWVDRMRVGDPVTVLD
jgi:uncharacterized protein YcbX